MGLLPLSLYRFKMFLIHHSRKVLEINCIFNIIITMAIIRVRTAIKVVTKGCSYPFFLDQS